MMFALILISGAFIVTLGLSKAKQAKDRRELRSRFRDEPTS